MEEAEKVKLQLADAAQKRAEQWQPVRVKNLPEPEKLDEYSMLGAHSYALVQSRKRLLKEVMRIKDEIVETPSAIARDYLRLEYGHGPHGTARQLQKVEGIQPVPSYAKTGKFAHGQYLDIKAAYWSIMMIIGWDCDYNPGMWLSPGKKPASFPFPEHHVARDCLVSSGRLLGIPTYNPKLLPKDPFGLVMKGSPLKNNQLPRLIHDILNSIAEACIKEGAVYCNNDGMICPSSNIVDRCNQIIEDWGLQARVKYEGSGEVRASGTYQIGTYSTMNFGSHVNELPISNIYAPSYSKWLQREFSFFAA